MKKLINYYDKTLCTAFGAGYWPWGPGTMGSAVGVLIWCLASMALKPDELRIFTLVAAALVTIISVPSINRLEREWGPDPSRVVIDEVVGVWISLICVPGYILATDSTIFLLWVFDTFMLFRLFDIIKPLGIKRMENLPGGWGVMADDILAGIYSLIIMFLVNRLIEVLIYI